MAWHGSPTAVTGWPPPNSPASSRCWRPTCPGTRRAAPPGTASRSQLADAGCSRASRAANAIWSPKSITPSRCLLGAQRDDQRRELVASRSAALDSSVSRLLAAVCAVSDVDLAPIRVVQGDARCSASTRCSASSPSSCTQVADQADDGLVQLDERPAGPAQRAVGELEAGRVGEQPGAAARRRCAGRARAAAGRRTRGRSTPSARRVVDARRRRPAAGPAGVGRRRRPAPSGSARPARSRPCW